MAFSHSPRTVTDGLILHLDAGNRKSYYSDSNSVFFDGTGDMLSIAPSTVLDLTGDFTIEAWFNTSGTAGWIVNKGGGFNIAWASYEIMINGSDIWFAASSANNGYDIGGENSTGRIGTFTAGQWTHVAVTRSGNVYRGFVNGVQGYTQTLALTPYSATTRGLNIGASYQTTWGVVGNIYNVFTGYISNVRIIKGTALYTSNFTVPSAPLTAVTNTSLLTCQNNTFVDNSTNNFAITTFGNARTHGHTPFNGTVWNNLSSPVNNASLISGPIFVSDNGGGIKFDGVDDYVTVNESTDMQPQLLTFDITFKIDSLTNTSYGGAPADRQYIVFRQNSRTANYEGYALVLLESNMTVIVWAFPADGTVYQLTSGISFVLNRIYNVCVVINNTTMDMYINGVFSASTAKAAGINYNATHTLKFGRAVAVGQAWDAAFNGTIYNYKMYNRILSASEIFQNYKANSARYGI